MLSLCTLYRMKVFSSHSVRFSSDSNVLVLGSAMAKRLLSEEIGNLGSLRKS